MPRDSIGNEIVLGSIIKMYYQVVKIDEHEPPDMTIDLHLIAVGKGLTPWQGMPEIEVEASLVTCESGPPDGWVPPEGTPPDALGMSRGLLPSAGDANDPFKVREEWERRLGRPSDKPATKPTPPTHKDEPHAAHKGR